MKHPLSPLLALALMALSSCSGILGLPNITLPAGIQSYLDANYSGYEVEESGKDTLCTGEVVYEVELEGENDDDDVELSFSSDGNLLFSETELAASALPGAVTASVAANFASYTIKEAALLSLSEGTTQYEVELKSGQTHLEVLFAADGTVICQQTDTEDNDD